MFKGVALSSCQQMGLGTFQTPPQRLNSHCMSVVFILIHPALRMATVFYLLSFIWLIEGNSSVTKTVPVFNHIGTCVVRINSCKDKDKL